MFYTRSLNRLEPYHPFEWGLFSQQVTVHGQPRRILTYIPETAPPSASGILVFGADGQTAEEVFNAGGWKSIADKDGGLIVFVLEPQNGRWNIDHTDPSGDLTYVQEALSKAVDRTHHCVHESKLYLFGTGTGGTLAHMAAMALPTLYAGVATVDAGEVNTAYREICRQAPCVNIHELDAEAVAEFKKVCQPSGGAAPESPTNASACKRNDTVPMPVWMAEHVDCAEASGTRQYWTVVNGADAQPHRITADIVEYRRSADTEYPLNQDREAYRVQHIHLPDAPSDPAGLAAKAWKEFLSRHQRWLADPGGDLRMKAHPVHDLAMERHTEEIGGWMREWYLYVPKSVRQHPEKPVPLVFALHGLGCNGEIYAGNSGWHRVAEERDFLVVYPTGAPGTLPFKMDPPLLPLPLWNFFHDTPNGPDEFQFFRVMLERTAAQHAVDRSRVYATGHSHGSLMTQALALGMPEMFAAVAPCSGVIFAPVFEQFAALEEFQRTSLPVPIWMHVGKMKAGCWPPIRRRRTPPEKPLPCGTGAMRWRDKWKQASTKRFGVLTPDAGMITATRMPPDVL